MRVIGALSVVALSACSSVAPIPSDVFLRPPLPVAPTPLAAELPPTHILINRPTASGLHQERALVVTRDGGRSLRQAQYQFWLDSPTQIVRDALSVCLGATVDSAQNRLERGSEMPLEVDSRIVRFEQAEVASANQMVVELDVALRVKRQAARRKVYAAQAAIQADEPAAYADAIGAALAAVCASLATDARASLLSQSGNTSP